VGDTLSPIVVLITGNQGEGKTSLAADLVRELQTRGHPVAGILAPGIWRDGVRIGFDIVDVATGKQAPLARAGETSDTMFGRFAFLPEGLKLGREALAPEKLSRAPIVLVDEVGRWELDNGGWAPQLDTLISVPPQVLILVVRKKFANEVASRWGRGTTIEAHASHSTAGQVLAAIEAAMK
jgi:nucleoside-triphosphatase